MATMLGFEVADASKNLLEMLAWHSRIPTCANHANKTKNCLFLIHSTMHGFGSSDLNVIEDQTDYRISSMANFLVDLVDDPVTAHIA